MDHFLDQFKGKLTSESELSILKRDRDEARTLASRLHNDLDRLSKEAEVAKQRAFVSERAAKAERDESKVAKLALLQSRNQLDATRAELVRVQQIAADRDAAANELHVSLLEAKTGLARAQQELEQIRHDRAAEPINDMDLLMAFKRMREVFEALQATLSCALCFETLGKGGSAPMSFACGHTFCHDCVTAWAMRSAMNKMAATKGHDGTPECPECRGDGTTRVKVYMLEEATRVMQRLEATDMAALPEDAPTPAADLDEEAAAILRPRERSRYATAA